MHPCLGEAVENLHARGRAAFALAQEPVLPGFNPRGCSIILGLLTKHKKRVACEHDWAGKRCKGVELGVRAGHVDLRQIRQNL